MRKVLKLVLCVLLGVSLLACSKEGQLTDGSYSSKQVGYGGEITITLTIEDGKIATVDLVGDDETASIGQAAFADLKEAIIKAQGSKIDLVSGATVTSNAVVAGVNDCLQQASGNTEKQKVALTDGTYTAQAWGFATNYPVTVEVTIADNKMVSIAVIDHGETEPILNSAIEKMIPEMIKLQSVKVDATTGATTSSNAIKLATEDCLKQALVASNESEDKISAFYVASLKSDEEVVINTDIIVVGMGGSGLAAATTAAETLYEKYDQNTDKVKVFAIDKAGKYGGTSATTTSPMSINPSYFVEQNDGNEYVDADQLKAAWMDYTEGDAKEWAIDVMMEESGNAVDYLIEKGFIFGAPEQGLSEPYKICVNYGGGFGTPKTEIATYFDKLVDEFVGYGGEYMIEVEATDLIQDESGAIIGVIAKGADGTEYTINAKAVILATGGFAGSSEMTQKYLSDEYYPLSDGEWNVYGMLQNDGKMIQAAIDKGAATYNIGVPPVSHIGGANKIMRDYPITTIEGSFDFWTGRESTTSLNDLPMMLAIAPNSLAVNREGVRFADETALSSYANWQAGSSFYTIWSSEMIDEIVNTGLRFNTLGIFINQGGLPALTPIPEAYDVLDTAVNNGIVVKADSLEELAVKLDIDATVLSKTVSDYNKYCDTRVNPVDGIVKSETVFGISGPIETDQDTFQKVEGEGPYYAVIGAPWIYSTVGGLDINESFQVLTSSGEAITGLYAVGTDSMGVLFTEKKEYVAYGGAAQGWAFTSGFLAGPIVAEEVSK
ncbi:MAG: FAD-binding protein [Erysipelotrichaceae bacterium]|nr:FAD-binding protein [Erysipelotrichaceae bacterium]MDD3924877.1 FAD-binding protein [Erysipelotrichaceae bacterium]MDD4643213.1 FAD-binding protein [Erysipelotrichaceae bacterium]